MNRRIKSLLLTTAYGLSLMFAAGNDDTLDTVVSLNNPYDDSFNRTATK